MTERSHRQAVTQNLADAGCGEQLIEEFWRLLGEGREQESLALLQQHRRCLLECCHAQQKKIDCLDYLIYQMEHHTN